MFEIAVGNDSHFGHETRRVHISRVKGIAADFCLACNVVAAYIFDDSWAREDAEAWVAQATGVVAPEMEPVEAEPSIATMIIDRLNELEDRLSSAFGFQRKPPQETSTDASENVDEQALSLVSFVEARMEKGALPVFELSREEVKEGVVVNDKGWIKKPVLRTGEWVETPTGSTEPLKVTLAHLKVIQSAFEDGAFERVCVPLGHGRTVDDIDWVTEHNTGYVMALEISQREDGEHSLDAWVDFTDPDTEKAIRLGNIWNCSVMLTPTVRPSDGKKFPIALKHVALTNYPWVEGLPGFVEASRYATVMQQAQSNENEEEPDTSDQRRTEMELTKEQEETLAALKQVAMTPEQIVTLARDQEAIVAAQGEIEQGRAEIEAEKARLAQEARGGHIDQIVLALEGKHNLDGVTAVEGCRHYPAVVKAVEAALRGVQAGESVQLSRQGGKEEAVDVDALVLGVVNAIPKEARLALSNTQVPDQARNVDDPDEIKPEDITEEDIAALDEL